MGRKRSKRGSSSSRTDESMPAGEEGSCKESTEGLNRLFEKNWSPTDLQSYMQTWTSYDMNLKLT